MDWLEHFKEVLNSGALNVQEEKYDRENDVYDDILDSEITEEEIRKAINKLKNGKASGPDCILAEMLKLGEKEIIQFLKKYFNMLLSKGLFPIEWTKAIITPIHKKGDFDKPDNYRGISLLSILSKVFTGVLNQRLNKWVEENDILTEAQAGFRKGRSTTDHIFTLSALIEKQFSKNSKLYVAFIDFKKAYDTINRSVLYSILANSGIQGKMLNIIRAMYSNVQACVRGSNGLTDYFECLQGLKQGCILSPVLFSILINELANDVINNGRHGVSLGAAELDLFLLLFADDLTLMAVTVVGLQNQLNSLSSSATRLGLTVNLDKSQIVVFRKGGFLSAKERWVLGRNDLTVVSFYKYLGLIFSSKHSFSLATEEIAVKGKKSVMGIMRTLRTIGCSSPEVFFKLFDAQVMPILLYGAEVWGDQSYKRLEQVHLYACKRFLRVTDKTPNNKVYGELGRYPLYIASSIKFIKYWFKLLNQPTNRYSKKAYLMLVDMDSRGTMTWASRVKRFLCENGFQQVWLFGCGNEKQFCVELRERLYSTFCHEWRDHIDSSEKCVTYSSYKNIFGRERYLTVLNIEIFRRYFAQFRMGVSQLNTHRFRFSNNWRKKLCPFCIDELETEIHFLFQCPAYSLLRNKYLSKLINTRKPENEQANELLMTQQDKDLLDVARFIKYAFISRASMFQL